MSNRLDELFSPDRLRQSWQNLPTPVCLLPDTMGNMDIHTQYFQLQRLITEKFPDVSWLPSRFEELTEKIDAVFGQEAIFPADDEQKQLIVSLLEDLEELIWATELSLRETP